MKQRTAQEVVRDMMQREIPEPMRKKLCEGYGLDLPHGITYGAALRARLLHDAKNGVAEAVEMVKQYGLE